MAFKKQTIQQICALLKIKEEEFNKAVTDPAEIDITIDENLQAFTKSEIEARDRNKYNDGKTAGVEMLVKDIKKSHNVDIAGTDSAAIVDAISKAAVAAANIAPDEKVKERDKLIEQWKSKHKEAEQALAAEKQRASEYATNAEILSVFPANRAATLTDQEYLSLIKNNYRIAEEDGKKVVYDVTTGNKIQDPKNLEPLPLKDVIANHFTTRKWVADQQQQQPRGGGGSGSSTFEPGKGFQKMSDLRKYATDNNIPITGEKFNAMVKDAVKENKDFVID